MIESFRSVFLDPIKFQLVYVKVKVWRVEARKQMFLQTYYEKFARAQVMR